MAKRITNKDLAATLYDLQRYIHETFGEFRQEFKYVHERIDRLEKKLVSEIRGVDDLDFRMQDIEEANIPKRVMKIEKKLATLPCTFL